MGMIPAGSPSVSIYHLFLHLDGFKNILCKVQTRPLKHMRNLETSAHKAKSHWAPALENFILILSCGGKVFPPLLHRARKGWSLH